MKPLKSGEPLSGQWDHVNRIGAGHQFTHNETINTREAMSRRSAGGRDLRTPLGGGGGGNINMRGLYVPGTTYALYDAVILGSGTSTGVYWSTIDNNNNAPDTGPGWLQISTVQGRVL